MEQSTSRTCVLIVEPERTTARHLAVVLAQGRGTADAPATVPEAAAPSNPRQGSVARCGMVTSLRELHDVPLDDLELVLCAATLPDGSALDVIAYLQGTRRDLAVIVHGPICDNVFAAEVIRAGALDYVVTGAGSLASLGLAVEKCRAHQRIKRENQRLHHELSRFVGELADKNLQLQMMIHQLEAMARTDELTGLANRRWLNEMLERSWAEAARHDRPMAFMMMDLDEFKRLNDHGGHQCGDAVLRVMGRVLIANCRQVDTAARYGGDEFCVLMPQTEAHEAAQVAQRVLREFQLGAQPLLPPGARTGLSIGVAQIDLSRPTSADQLIAHADEAMYAAKSSRQHSIMLRGPGGPKAWRDAAPLAPPICVDS